MADDNIFNIPNQEQNPMEETQNTENVPNLEQNIENSTQQTNEAPDAAQQLSAQENIEAQNVPHTNEQGGFYTQQNTAYPSRGTYYSYTPNPNSYGGQYNNGQQYYQQGYYNNQGYQPQQQKKRRGLKITLSIAGIVAVATLICLVGYWTVSEGYKIIVGRHNTSSALSENGDNGETGSYDQLVIYKKPDGSDEYTVNSDGTMSAASVIDKVRPSIVGIVQYVNTNNQIPVMNSQGSGIIISEDGYIITNAHVVEGAAMITVVLDNDEEYRATLKGLDNQSDLAVLKIEANGLKAAELGDSSETVVGESVIAIGNPGGLDLAGSCTGGMVSGLNRTISSDDATGYAMKYIQTDAAINPGNSGGALVNMYGQVIGINSAKVSADGYEGLGFAIPVNEALPIIGDLRNFGYVKNRAKIGVSFQLITETVSQYYNNTIPAGMLITEIDKTCDIATKGVQTQDIITHIDGKAVTSTSVVYSILQNKKPGDTIRLTVYRIGARVTSSKTFEVDVILAEDKGQ